MEGQVIIDTPRENCTPILSWEELPQPRSYNSRELEFTSSRKKMKKIGCMISTFNEEIEASFSPTEIKTNIPS
jgi:hypothetical protein